MIINNKVRAIEQISVLKYTCPILSIKTSLVSIFDGIPLVPIFKCTGLTYNEFTDGLLKYVVVRRSGSKRIDSVFDVYYENSIKMLKEEIALLVSYSSKILLAYLKLSNGVPFSQIETIKQS